jgi:hypothetical protein
MNPTPVTDTMECGVPGVPLEPGHKCFCVVDSSPTSRVVDDLGDDAATSATLSQHQLELFIAGEMRWALHDLHDLPDERGKLVVSGQFVENPYYLPPDQYLSSTS